MFCKKPNLHRPFRPPNRIPPQRDQSGTDPQSCRQILSCHTHAAPIQFFLPVTSPLRLSTKTRTQESILGMFKYKDFTSFSFEFPANVGSAAFFASHTTQDNIAASSSGEQFVKVPLNTSSVTINSFWLPISQANRPFNRTGKKCSHHLQLC